MPRALKTYTTNLGFFELAIAAPSMKAALEAWGMSHNAFQQGFAKQTDDARIIVATMAQPGVVLKRAVGSTGKFSENAALPKSLPDIKPPKIAVARPLQRSPAKPPTKAKSEKKTSKADVISFERARAKREKERAAEQARVDKVRDARQRATAKSEAALERARGRHENAMAVLEAEQKKLDQRSEIERNRWGAERKKLEAAVDRAKK